MKNLLYCIILLAFGIYFVVTPAEKLQQTFPKAKSVKALRIAGGIAIACGILMVVLFLIG